MSLFSINAPSALLNSVEPVSYRPALIVGACIFVAISVISGLIIYNTDKKKHVSADGYNLNPDGSLALNAKGQPTRYSLVGSVGAAAIFASVFSIAGGAAIYRLMFCSKNPAVCAVQSVVSSIFQPRTIVQRF